MLLVGSYNKVSTAWKPGCGRRIVITPGFTPKWTGQECTCSWTCEQRNNSQPHKYRYNLHPQSKNGAAFPARNTQKTNRIKSDEVLTETEPCVFSLCKGKQSVENKTEICILNNQCDLTVIHSVANKLKYETDLSEKKIILPRFSHLHPCISQEALSEQEHFLLLHRSTDSDSSDLPSSYSI